MGCASAIAQRRVLPESQEYARAIVLSRVPIGKTLEEADAALREWGFARRDLEAGEEVAGEAEEVVYRANDKVYWAVERHMTITIVPSGGRVAELSVEYQYTGL
jgi:hypothetical protein